MQVNIDQSQTQGAGSAIPIYDPQDMLDEIKSEIVKVRETLATLETDVGETTKAELAISDSFTSALAITSNLFAVILSGTMIMSAHRSAHQARSITTIARNFEFDVPLREDLVDRKVTSDDCSTSNDDNPIQTSAAGQSESCADQQLWDGIWNSSTISLLQQEPTAEEAKQPDGDYSVRKVSSSNSPLRETC